MDFFKCNISSSLVLGNEIITEYHNNTLKQISTKRLMKIGIDLDEILADLVNPLIVWHNGVYGTNLERNNLTSYSLEEIWGGSREDTERKFKEFYQSRNFKGIVPVRDSQKGIGNLSSRNELIVITSRPRYLYEETLQWLEKHFPDRFQGVELTSNWNEGGEGRKKSEACQDLGVDLIVEDSLGYAKDCADMNVRVLLLDCPWNRGDLDTRRITRVYSWEDIEKEATRT